MEDIAAEIVAAHEPSEGWQNSDSEQLLREIAETMLDEMDVDTVEECFETIAAVMKAEHGE